jgi:hypothetical protein
VTPEVIRRITQEDKSSHIVSQLPPNALSHVFLIDSLPCMPIQPPLMHGKAAYFHSSPPKATAYQLICYHPTPSTPSVSAPSSPWPLRDSAVCAQVAGRAGTCLLCIWRRCSFRLLSRGSLSRGIRRGRRRPLRSLSEVSGGGGDGENKGGALFWTSSVWRWGCMLDVCNCRVVQSSPLRVAVLWWRVLGC